MTPEPFPSTGSNADEPLRVPPWEERERYGLLNALYLTVKEVLSAPGPFFSRMPTRVGLTQPVLFAIVMSVVASFFDWLWSLGGVHVPLAAHSRFFELIQGPFFLGATFVFSPLIAIMQLFVRAAVFHACLMLVGGDRLGFEATARVVAYARAAAILALLPICGRTLGGIAEIAITIIGLARTHGVDPWRPLVAVLAPVLLVAALVSFAMVLIFGAGLVQ